MIAEREKAHECCSSGGSWGGEDSLEGGGLADPPAGGYVNLNATHCPLLMSDATPYCDKINGLSLSNRTLDLREMKKLTRPSHWFWDFFSLKSSGGGRPVRGCLPLLLVCLLALNRLAGKMNPS